MHNLTRWAKAPFARAGAFDFLALLCCNVSMFSLLKQFLIEWNSGKNQRSKLQQAYVILAIGLTIAAGLSSLSQADLSRSLMLLATFLAAVYLVNGATWAILEAFVTPRLPKPAPTTTAKAKKTSKR